MLYHAFLLLELVLLAVLPMFTSMLGIKYGALFWVIQCVSVHLEFAGWFLIAGIVMSGQVRLGEDGKFHFPPWAVLWDNKEDGVCPGKYSRWGTWYWSAWRNSVNNLRYVRGVSGVGRPLWIKNFIYKGEIHYAKVGWMSNGFPAISVGSGAW